MASEAVTVTIPRGLYERLRREAERLGEPLEEYIVELLSQGLDPAERARGYLEAARSLLAQAERELEEGDVRQAAEKLWGAAALAVKAHALQRLGKRLSSHGELWEYTRRMIEELGDWVHDAWMSANGMHTCFYEGWCTELHVREAARRIKRLVEAIAEEMGRG